jgi:hypothetical protein
MVEKSKPTTAELAERGQRRRTRILWAQAAFFIIWQGAFFHGRGDLTAPLRTVDHVRLSAFAVWAAALLVLLASGGGLLRGKAVRAIMEDEVTKAHRAEAFLWGYWAMAVASLVLYVLSQFATVATIEAVHIILSLGVVIPALRFVILERRSQRHG